MALGVTDHEGRVLEACREEALQKRKKSASEGRGSLARGARRSRIFSFGTRIRDDWAERSVMWSRKSFAITRNKRLFIPRRRRRQTCDAVLYVIPNVSATIFG